MANKIETLALEIGDKVSEKLGMYLVDAEYKKDAGRMVLRLFVDKEGGTGIDDCESYSRAFETEFDAVDPIDGEYVLEVSSPGVDRKLETIREFKYYSGRTVDVKLYKAIDGKKEFTGILKSFSDELVEIESDGKIFEFDKKESVYIKLHFEF